MFGVTSAANPDAAIVAALAFNPVLDVPACRRTRVGSDLLANHVRERVASVPGECALGANTGAARHRERDRSRCAAEALPRN